ncbi:MAG: Ig domain-containing protein [Acidobacteriota bacterium]
MLPHAHTISLSPPTLPAGLLNVPYSETITASGGDAPYVFTTLPASLPPGLSLSAGGVLSGTPTTSGTFVFGVTATDNCGYQGFRSYSVVVTCLQISPPTLPDATFGVPYSETLSVAGGVPPYTFAVIGPLPPGLSLGPSGILAGTPTSVGTFPFSISVRDAGSCSASQPYTIVVRPDCAGVAIDVSPPVLPGGTVGVTYGATIGASGGAAPYTFMVTSGTLPPGLVLGPSGTLSGTPATAGVYTFTVTATDVRYCSGTRTYTTAFSSRIDFAVGQGLGQPNLNEVRVYTPNGTLTPVDFYAYAAGQWGVNVSSGVVDGGWSDDILTAPGPGPTFGPQVRGFLRDGSPLGKVSYFAYSTLRFGANVCPRSLDGDPFEEIVTGAGPGAVFGPHVRGWNYDNVAITALGKVSYFAYGTLKYGVNVAMGSVDDDAFSEVLTGPGPGPSFGPQVRGWNYDGAIVTAIAKLNYLPFTPSGYGVNVTAADFDGDGYDEVGASPGPGPAQTSRFVAHGYDGVAVTFMTGFDVTPFPTTYGGRLGGGDVSADGREDLVAGAGRDPSADATVRSFSYQGGGLVPIPNPFLAFPTALYGVNVSTAALSY